MAVKRNRLSQSDLTENVFSKGCLIYLKIRCWGARSALKEEFYGQDMPPEITRAVYDLLPNETFLNTIHDMRDEAKRYLYRNSMPAPVDGLVFVHKIKITEIDAGLKRRQEDFYGKVDQWLEVYDGEKQKHKKLYPKLHDDTKYPSRRIMKSKFFFGWSFRHFQVPDSKLGILTPEIYEEEVRRAKADAVAMRNTIVSTAGQMFLDKINSLKDQCLGGKINTATVNSLKTFLDNFESSWGDFVGQGKMHEMVADCKLYLDDIGADELRYDDGYKEMVGQELKSISEAFSKIPDARFQMKRRLDV